MNPIKLQQPNRSAQTVDSNASQGVGTRRKKPCPSSVGEKIKKNKKNPGKGKTIRLLYRAVSRPNVGEIIDRIWRERERERERKRESREKVPSQLRVSVSRFGQTRAWSSEDFMRGFDPLVITRSTDLRATRPFRHEPRRGVNTRGPNTASRASKHDKLFHAAAELYPSGVSRLPLPRNDPNDRQI